MLYFGRKAAVQLMLIAKKPASDHPNETNSDKTLQSYVIGGEHNRKSTQRAAVVPHHVRCSFFSFFFSCQSVRVPWESFSTSLITIAQPSSCGRVSSRQLL